MTTYTWDTKFYEKTLKMKNSPDVSLHRKKI